MDDARRQRKILRAASFNHLGRDRPEKTMKTLRHREPTLRQGDTKVETIEISEISGISDAFSDDSCHRQHTQAESRITNLPSNNVVSCDSAPPSMAANSVSTACREIDS